MSFNTTGYVLKAARSAPCNATGTAPANSGVLREHVDLPGSYSLPGAFVEVAADQYRASVLDSPTGGTQEYLLWAANSSNLAVLEDPSWEIDQGTGTIPVGSIIVLSNVTDTVGIGGFTAGVPGVSNPTVITVGVGTFSIGDVIQIAGTASDDGLFEVLSHIGNVLTVFGIGLFPITRAGVSTQFVTDGMVVGTITKTAFADGTDRVIVTDGGSRSIAGVTGITVTRGDDPLTGIALTFASQDADAGLVVLDGASLSALGGGLSQSRGDSVVLVTYYLAAQKFWWTRNDSYLKRFGWNGAIQRWEPFRGGKPVDLGGIQTSTTLLPHPSRFTVGDTLPGDPLFPDARAMVRIGRKPDAASSTPANVLVVTDDEAAATYSFLPGTDAVVGVSSGVIQWNPITITANAGQGTWYLPETFPEKAVGILGDLKTAGSTLPLFLCPIPGPTDYPFIRLGSRRYLRAVMASTDADLSALSVAEGEVGWSLSTGLLKFSPTDIAKSDPDNVGFDLSYLGAVVVYDGVSLTRVAIGTRAPVQLVDSAGTPTTVDAFKALYIPASAPLPSPGTSGIMLVPDGTGIVPNASVTPTTRPNGSGLVRQVAGSGDVIVFGQSRCMETVETVEFEAGLPLFPFLIRKGKAVIAEELGAAGSKVAIGLKDRGIFAGLPLYFLQAEVQPTLFATEARLVSRVRESYVLSGTEVLAFAIDGTSYTWNASLLGAGTFSAAVVSASIASVITGTGTAYALLGFIILEAGDTSTGSVEIGFGSTSSGAFADRDLSGCSVLGFPPGWRVDNPSTNDNWLVDSGLAFGLSRSPKNLDMSLEQADFQARGRFTDAVLSRSVTASPVFFVNNPPLLDIPGYDDGIFFQTIDGAFRRSLNSFEDVLYDFENGRFSWLVVGSVIKGVASPLTSLDLGGRGVVGLTLHPAVGDGYGLYTDIIGAPFVLQTLGTDYLLDQSGQPGTATLIEKVGALITVGSRGSFSSGGTTFTDPEATFVTDGVVAGYLLEITSTAGTAVGSYVVASVSGETTLDVDPSVPFPEVGTNIPWEIREGFTESVFDPAILADILYDDFNHLPSEPFQVWTLSPLGLTPVDAGSQSGSRLQGVVSEGLAHGRIITVRFGQAIGSPEASLTVLTRKQLGTMANGVLAVPDLTDEHYLTGAFSIMVGAQSYVVGTNLVGVTVFSDPLSGDQVEYGLPSSGIDGQLNFGADTLSTLGESLVYYVQEFTDPANLVAGEAEVEPTTGDMNLSAADMASYGGVGAYFVEQMITEKRFDVVIGPVQGAVHFRRPLRPFMIVEVHYFQADSSGNKTSVEVTEFLPLFVRLEAATANSTIEYAFNPTGRTVRADINTQVWVNNRLQNYGNTSQCTVDTDASVIRFVTPVASTSVVQISYAVNETFGGEQGFTVSTPPVYRPPFFLLAGASTFSLLTDRTADMVPGKLLRVGAAVFYVKSAFYNGVSDTTTVGIFPTPDREAGSRAPGNDVLTLLSTTPVTTLVDGVVTDGSPGFLLTLSAAYEPVDEGMVSIVFRGNVTSYTIAGHLLEIGGYPLMCGGSVLSTDGLTTTVHMTSPFLRGFDPTVDVVKVSVRPIYPPAAQNLLGLSPVVPNEPVRVLLFGEVLPNGTPLPGRTLVLGKDYSFKTSTGDVTLTQGLIPGQRVLLSYTKIRTLAPISQDGMILVPRYKAKYAHVVIPDSVNRFLASYLVGTYSFTSPDTFYVRAVPVMTYLGEVAKIAADRVASRTPHGGPMVVSGPAMDNWQFGTLPVQAQERELLDQDRAARVFITLYDSIIQAFEQVKEAIDGSVVGDRDGKFRFFIGQGKTYGGPGYEDEITGILNPRFVWSQVFEASNGSFGVSQIDPLVEPETATQDPVTLEVGGNTMNPWLLDYYIREQRKYVLNDMDDLALVAKGRVRQFGPPYEMKVSGVFRQMWDASVISRLYPEATLAFTTTYPGLLSGTLPQEPGVYAFLRYLHRPNLLKGTGPVLGSTFGMDIGDVGNPAIGLITNITGQVHPRARLARARIWAYSATGFPELGGPSKPSIIATPLFLRDFPIDQETGSPDLTQLAKQGGTLLDLSTGDYELSTPAWVGYDDTLGFRPQVAFGKPNGETYAVAYVAKTLTSAFSGGLPYATPVYKGLFVSQVYSGCILTFTDGGASATEIDNAADIAAVDQDGIGTLPFAPVYGDTIYVTIPGNEDASTFSDPPTVKDLKKFAASHPFFTGTAVRERRSSFIDLSLPSFEDPLYPMKEMAAQRCAQPLQPIEADVEFVNTLRDPLEFPALQGLCTNDSGDYAIPYLTSSNTELDRLGAVQATFTAITQTDSPAPNAVYPDEIVGNDGSILAVASGAIPPATLLSSRDMTPVTTLGAYVPHSGIGDARRYDLLLVEAGTVAIPLGVQGILSVGEVTTDTLEVPRFVSPSLVGTRIRYTFNNVMVHLSPTGLSGITVQENGGLTTTFDISSIGGLFLNDGSGAAVGGLNNVVDGLFAYPNNNLVSIDIIDHATGLVIEVILLTGNSATGGLGTVGLIVAAPTFTNKVITISAVGFVDFVALGGVAPGPVGPFDFRVSIDTFVLAATPNTGTNTGYIGNDRLTFIESIDLRTVLPRGSLTVGGVSVQGELSVQRVTASGADTCTVNNPATVNGGSAFTFLARDAGSPNSIGTFDPSPGTGQGTVKVMAFEGASNVALPSTGAFTFSAVPSSDQSATGAILSGTGSVADDGDRVQSITVATGGIANVIAGDVLSITGSSVGDAAVTTGTYIVRHAIPDGGAGYTEVFPSTATGTDSGWVTSPFPKVMSSSVIPFRIVLDTIQVVSSSPSGYDFAGTGRLFLILDINDLTSVVSVEYTAITPVGDNFRFTLTLNSGLAADGVTPVTNANVKVAADAAIFVSGMAYVPIKQLPSPCPSNNTVGYPTLTVAGFINITIQGVAGSHPFAFGADLVAAPPLALSLNLGVAVSDAITTNDSTAFLPDITIPIYQGVPLYLDLTGVNDPEDAGTRGFWTVIQGAPSAGVTCLVPGMSLYGHNGAKLVGTGFQAQAGVFIEPSVPQSTLDLNSGEVKVVDAGHTVTVLTPLGMRKPSDAGITSPETVSFTVRRIRRFHPVLDALGSNLAPLRFAYEIRTGTVFSYTSATRMLVANPDPDSGSGTQLGAFDNQDVNINPGDEVRILDASGNVLDSAEVAANVGGVTLWLRSPGFTDYLPVGGEVFQVYLKQAPVPHAQSNEQLLDLITDKVILTRTADPVTGDGGSVPVTVNVMADSIDFTTLDPLPLPGDIVLVDPAGTLHGPTGDPVPAESGERPVGDQSVSTRVDGSYIAGGPSDLDDNRGWYRITVVDTTLTVSGVTDFSGANGSPVIMGSTSPTDQQFAVLPDINGSGLTGTTEGQMDLRLTKVALPSNSYQDGSFKSIAPFSYRIIRPTKLVSAETVDLVLFIRERMLSWMEEMHAAVRAKKQGSYFVFQRDEHIEDLGSATDGDDGLGVPSNVFIFGLTGLTGFAPFANTSDCLSVLDRRYWLQDTRLDSEFPPYGGTDPYSSFEVDNSTSGYTIGSGRPVEPDLIDGVLDRTDRLRDQRYAWIKFRANQDNGTLPSINRFLADLPRLLQEQADFLRLQQSLTDAGST